MDGKSVSIVRLHKQSTRGEELCAFIIAVEKLWPCAIWSGLSSTPNFGCVACSCRRESAHRVCTFPAAITMSMPCIQMLWFMIRNGETKKVASETTRLPTTCEYTILHGCNVLPSTEWASINPCTNEVKNWLTTTLIFCGLLCRHCFSQSMTTSARESAMARKAW